jgi:5-methylcytosine-specific restriction protein A
MARMLVETYLFAWNPKLWDWPTLERDRRRLARRGFLDTEWSSGRARKLEPGSRAFLVRCGVEPRGIFGCGTVMTAPVERLHWREDKAAEGRTTGYVMLRLDALFATPPILLDELARPPFGGFRWTVRQSGTRVPAHLAEPLDALWLERLNRIEERP